MSEEPKGVVACFINEHGRVIASVSDFDNSGYGGFTLAQAQRIRAKAQLSRAVADAYASCDFVRAIGYHEMNKIMDELVRKHKCRVHYHFVGQDPEDAA